MATVSPAAATAYFRSALALCKLTRTEPSILLHPLDFLHGSECKELAFFPAMNLDWDVKRGILLDSIRALAKAFDVVPMRETVQPSGTKVPVLDVFGKKGLRPDVAPHGSRALE